MQYYEKKSVGLNTLSPAVLSPFIKDGKKISLDLASYYRSSSYRSDYNYYGEEPARHDINRYETIVNLFSNNFRTVIDPAFSTTCSVHLLGDVVEYDLHWIAKDKYDDFARANGVAQGRRQRPYSGSKYVGSTVFPFVCSRPFFDQTQIALKSVINNNCLGCKMDDGVNTVKKYAMNCINLENNAISLIDLSKNIVGLIHKEYEKDTGFGSISDWLKVKDLNIFGKKLYEAVKAIDTRYIGLFGEALIFNAKFYLKYKCTAQAIRYGLLDSSRRISGALDIGKDPTISICNSCFVDEEQLIINNLDGDVVKVINFSTKPKITGDDEANKFLPRLRRKIEL